MAKILLYLTPEIGAYNASFCLADEIKKHNHKIVYMGPANFKEYVEKEGFTFVPYPTNSEDDIKKIQDKSQAIKKMSFLKKRKELKKEQKRLIIKSINEYNTTIDSINPDLILLDPLLSAFTISFLQKKIPILNINTTLAYRFRLTSPSHFSTRIPRDPQFLKNRFMNFITWISLWGRKTNGILFNWIKKNPIRSLIFVYRARRKLSNWKRNVRKFGGNIFWGEYGFRLKLPEIVLAPSEIDTPWNVSFDGRFYVGACVHQNRKEIQFDNEILLESDKPLVYCAFGTYSKGYPHALHLINVLIDSFRSRPQYNLLIQIDESITPHINKELPDNIFIAKFVPQLKILKQATCFITHGGFSSLREACFFGVPLIVFPCWLDQFGNSARVVFHNIGVRGNIKTVTKGDLDHLFDKVMNDTSIRESMNKMSAAFHQNESYAKAVEHIERFI